MMMKDDDDGGFSTTQKTKQIKPCILFLLQSSPKGTPEI
jgi:hypothetical protein